MVSMGCGLAASSSVVCVRWAVPHAETAQSGRSHRCSSPLPLSSHRAQGRADCPSPQTLLAPVKTPPEAGARTMQAARCAVRAQPWRAEPQPQGQQRRLAPRVAAATAAQQGRPAPPHAADGQQRAWTHAAASWAAGVGAAGLLLLGSGAPALAAARSPPIAESVGRCDIAALDKFAGGS